MEAAAKGVKKFVYASSSSVCDEPNLPKQRQEGNLFLRMP